MPLRTSLGASEPPSLSDIPTPVLQGPPAGRAAANGGRYATGEDATSPLKDGHAGPGVVPATSPDVGPDLGTEKEQQRGAVSGEGTEVDADRPAAAKTGPGDHDTDLLEGRGGSSSAAVLPVASSVQQQPAGDVGSPTVRLAETLGAGAVEGRENGGEGEEYFSLLEGIRARSRSGNLSSRGSSTAHLASLSADADARPNSPLSSTPVIRGEGRLSQGGEPLDTETPLIAKGQVGLGDPEPRGLEFEPRRLGGLGVAVREDVPGLGFGFDKGAGVSGDRAHLSPNSQVSVESARHDADAGTPDVSGGTSGFGNSYTFPVSPPAHSVSSDTEGESLSSSMPQRDGREACEVESCPKR